MRASPRTFPSCPAQFPENHGRNLPAPRGSRPRPSVVRRPDLQARLQPGPQRAVPESGETSGPTGTPTPTTEPAPTPPAPQAAAETEGGVCRGGGAGGERNATNFPRALAGHCSCPPASRELAPCSLGGPGPGLRAWGLGPRALLTRHLADVFPDSGLRPGLGSEAPSHPCRGQHLRPRGVRGVAGVGVGGCPSLKHPPLHQSRSQQGPPERVSKIVSLQELKCWPSGLIEVYFRCRAVVQSLSFEIDPNDAL